MLTKTKSPLHVLITRPKVKGRVLAQQLQTLGIKTTCQPFFDYQATPILPLKNDNTPNIIIFVSVAAVHYAQKSADVTHWLQPNTPALICAVGQATQQALNAMTSKKVHCPTIQTSEGLLTLEVLQNVEKINVRIVRGNGGREYLATALSERGAMVQYLEAYSRKWYKIDNKIIKQWQATKINCIVITSNDLLEKVSTFINSTLCTEADKITCYWYQECTWLVVSERIAQSARSLGIKNIINCDGASDNAISQALVKFE